MGFFAHVQTVDTRPFFCVCNRPGYKASMYTSCTCWVYVPFCIIAGPASADITHASNHRQLHVDYVFSSTVISYNDTSSYFNAINRPHYTTSILRSVTQLTLHPVYCMWVSLCMISLVGLSIDLSTERTDWDHRDQYHICCDWSTYHYSTV